jgi:hypothetical protein
MELFDCETGETAKLMARTTEQTLQHHRNDTGSPCVRHTAKGFNIGFSRERITYAIRRMDHEM